MGKKLRQDATGSTDGILYQFYTVLECCFNMEQADVLYIEKYGDISYGESNIEVKRYGQKLGDTHPNFWKSLYNWMNENFEDNLYSNLVIITTQEYTKNSKLKKFNDMTVDERISCLTYIKDEYIKKEQEKDKKKKENLDEVKEQKKKDIQKYFEYCFNEKNTEKLKSVLSKIKICATAPSDKELIISVATKYANHIELENRMDYLKGLLGYIIIPRTDSTSKWQISKNDFDEECNKQTEKYTSLKKVFPYYENDKALDISSYEDFVFVKKIKDINYEEDDIIREAIFEYSDAKKFLLEDFISGSLLLDEHNKYRREHYKSYLRAYRKKCRNTTSNNIIKDSQDFYDETTNCDALPFMEFIDNAPKRFRNGTLHVIADEDNADEMLIWKLKEEKNE